MAALGGNVAHAAGLGPIRVESALGEPLRLSVPLLGDSSSVTEARCIRAEVAALDARPLVRPTVSLQRNDHAVVIHLRSTQGINEPVLNVGITLACEASVRRNYQVLLDPPAGNRADTAAVMAPIVVPTHPAATPLPPGRQQQTLHRAPATSARRPATAVVYRQRHVNAATSVTGHPRGQAILRLSPPAVIAVADYRDRPLRLRLSERLTLPAAGFPVAGPATATNSAGSASASAAASDSVPAPSDRQLEREAQRLLQDLQAQAASLRVETARIRQQNASYRGELESAHDASLNWIKGLGVLLAACAAALAWLLWRVTAMKQRQAHPWHELFTGQATDTIDSALLESNTGFGTTGFDLSEIRTADFSGGTTAGPAAATVFQPAAFTTITDADTPAQPPSSTAADGASRVRQPPAPTRSTPASSAAITAEEVSDVMELVEAWMALNAPDQVLELLKPFSDVEQPESPLPWLCLLDVYRALGEQQKYEAILERIKTIFNVKLAPWTPLPYVEHPKTLADFPHVIEEIVTRWHRGDVLPYLKGLLVDDRAGTRHGFDLAVYRDILQLITVAGETGALSDDRSMPEKAYQILFRPQQEEAENAPPIANTVPSAASGTPASAPAPTRPKYRTPACERVPAHEAATASAVTQQQSPELETLAHVANPAAASPPPQPQPRRGTPASTHENDMTPMAIKLHLAIAYQDIGDKEGACLLLDEVMQGGTSEQSEQARQMRERLA